MSTSRVRLRLPELHPVQEEIKQGAARFNVINCGRRFGKDVLLMDRALTSAASGKPVAWFNPSYPMLTEVWAEVKRLAYPMTKRVDAQQHRIELVTGGLIDMWSLDAFDSARGRMYADAIINEAAMARHLQEAWENVIRPTLTDFQGSAWFASTPKGRNYFWQLAERGKIGDVDWRYFHAPTSANPFIPLAEIEDARRDLPDLVFRQEYLAEFIEGSGVVFRRVRECINQYDEWPVHPYAGAFTIGLDWAQKHDFTVAVVLDRRTRRVVEIERFNQIDWAFQRERVKALYRKWGADLIVAEENSIGGPNIEALVEDNINVWPFHTSAVSKNKLIQALVMEIEQKRITIPDDKVLIHELEAYEGELGAGGLMKYSAPEGGHDDCVIALALAVFGSQA